MPSHNAPGGAAPAAVGRGHAPEVVFVVGAGRSGTSTVAGILSLLGFAVPQPEVVADETNPKGFHEPRWLVDFHDELLRRAAVGQGDARPVAWEKTRSLSENPDVRRRARAWLAGHLEVSERLVIKDPRTAWFLDLWRDTAEELGGRACFVVMLREPAEVLGSRKAYYGAPFGDPHLVASWMNIMLETERSTRGAKRVFVGYDELLRDPRAAVARIGRALDLAVLLDLDTEQRARVEEFVDPSLRRVRHPWEDVQIPAELRSVAEGLWSSLGRLAEPGGDAVETCRTLDEVWARFTRLYADAEALTWSSAQAARTAGRRQERRAQRDHPPGGGHHRAGLRARLTQVVRRLRR